MGADDPVATKAFLECLDIPAPSDPQPWAALIRLEAMRRQGAGDFGHSVADVLARFGGTALGPYIAVYQLSERVKEHDYEMALDMAVSLAAVPNPTSVRGKAVDLGALALLQGRLSP